MDKYGQLIDGFDPHRDEVYSLITQYFDDVVMTKTEVVNGLAFWAVRSPAVLLREFRYVIAVCPEDGSPERTTRPLSQLRWVSFQTRTLDKDWRLKPVKLADKNDAKFRIPIRQTRIDQDTDTFYYSVDNLPLEVALLTPKKTFPTYQKEGNLMRALETYQTVLIFTD